MIINLFGRNSGPPPLVVSWHSLSRLAKGWRLFHRPSIAAQQAVLQVVECFLQLHDLAEIWGFNTISYHIRCFICMTTIGFYQNDKTFTGKLTSGWQWKIRVCVSVVDVDLCNILTTDLRQDHLLDGYDQNAKSRLGGHVSSVDRRVVESIQIWPTCLPEAPGL